MDRATALGTTYLGIIAVWGTLVVVKFSPISTTVFAIEVGVGFFSLYLAWPLPPRFRPERPKVVSDLSTSLNEFCLRWNMAEGWRSKIGVGSGPVIADAMTENRDTIIKAHSAMVGGNLKLSTTIDMEVQNVVHDIQRIIEAAKVARTNDTTLRVGDKIVERISKITYQLDKDFPS